VRVLWSTNGTGGRYPWDGPCANVRQPRFLMWLRYSGY
jgi:hypothetical protein